MHDETELELAYDDGEGYAAGDYGVSANGWIWLHDLPALLEARSIPYRLESGWDTRSRSSGGYDSIKGLGIHHTASDTTPENDAAWMWHNSPDRPIGALLLDRAGVVHIGAAGATNTQGKGGPVEGSLGWVPLDDGNRHMISIEAANNGTGEAWPAAQIETYLELCAALCEGYGLDPLRDIWTHYGYCEPSAPGRKIDPAGPTPSELSLAPDGGTWDQQDFRELVAERMTPRTDAEMIVTTPKRFYDTRGLGSRVPPGQYSVTPPVPASAVAVHIQLTALEAADPGYLVAWDEGERPDSSSLNYEAGQPIGNALPVPLDDAGTFQLWTRAETHILIDVLGYYV